MSNNQSPKICANMRCLKKAADILNIKTEQIDENGNYLILKKGNKNYHFIYWNTPFNNQSIAQMCKDKDFSFKFLKDELKTPKTKSYLNPKCLPRNRIFLKNKTIDEIVSDIKDNFSFPVIVKKNSGSLGINVFKCNNISSVKNSLEKIFNKRSKNYDRIALVQEYIDIKHEYRVVRFNNKNIIIYEKICNNKSQNLSPLHNPNSTTRVIDLNSDEAKKIDSFLKKSKRLKEVVFCGIDLAKTKKGNYVLIELNTRPGFGKLESHSGTDVVVDVYKKILKNI
jgi:glutathione synthase/RimK-type ligase-like ATP-grasp enzyme